MYCNLAPWVLSCNRNDETVSPNELHAFNLFENSDYIKYVMNLDGSYSFVEDEKLVHEKLVHLLSSGEDNFLKELQGFGFTTTDDEGNRPYFYFNALSNEDKIVTGFIFVEKIKDENFATTRGSDVLVPIGYCVGDACCTKCSGITQNGACYCTKGNQNCGVTGSCELKIKIVYF